jgi:CHAT domain
VRQGLRVDELRLEIRDFADANRWRWVLTNARGQFLADHDVRLDRASWQREAFSDLHGYLRWHVAPDRWVEQEAMVVARVGDWIGEHVFGRVGPALVKQRPATVRVVVPREAAQLMFAPLELGHVEGKPIAVQGVTLVMECVAENAVGRSAAPVGDRLRVLGLFSLPAVGRPLNLRKERCAFMAMFDQLGSVDRAVDVRVLQYGATRQRLRDVLEEGGGWDLIHVSGHGTLGDLLLEKEDGSPDPVTADDLVDMLDLARERVTVSACWSAAPTLAEQRRLLQLPEPKVSHAARVEPRRASDSRPDQHQAAALASALAERLPCAVPAMRYPVADDFAIALTTKLYDLLASKGRPLPQALGMALKDPHGIATPPTAGCPALSVATPALFGAPALDLRLRAPQRSIEVSFDTRMLKLPGFPPPPDRFVGRTAVMARASAGVLLYGMPGSGKTACALELACSHEHAFERLVWFKAPGEGLDIADALPAFGLALEMGLPGLQVVHLLDDVTRLAVFLPSLTELCERRRVLIMVDNIESLLTEGGQWRDRRWESLVAALCGHAGLGRVVLTSRRRPGSLDSRMRTAPVGALSLDEALLVSRELRHLSAMIGGTLPGLDPDVARRMALRVLEVAQGHPKLLELADAQAAKPEQLTEVIGRWGSGRRCTARSWTGPRRRSPPRLPR